MIDLINTATDGNFWSVIFGTSGNSIAALIGSADANHPLLAVVAKISWWLLIGLGFTGMYTAFMGLFDTMRTGRAGGDSVSVWSVARWVASLLGMIPVLGGISVFSWIVLCGAYFGNSLGNTAATYYKGVILSDTQVTANIVAAARLPDTRKGYQAVLGLYNIAFCAKTMQDTTVGTISPITMRAVIQSPQRQTIGGEQYYVSGISYEAANVALGPAACGSVKVKIPMTLAAGVNMPFNDIHKRGVAQYLALITAQQAVQVLINNGTTGEILDQRLMEIAETFNASEASSVASSIQAMGNRIGAQTPQLADETSNGGWMMLGAWYYRQGAKFQTGRDTAESGSIIARSGNAEASKFSTSQMSIDMSRAGRGVTTEREMSFTQKMGLAAYSTLATASNYAAMAEKLMNTVMSEAEPLAAVTRLIFDGVVDPREAANSFATRYVQFGGGDPVRSLQALGGTLMGTVEIVYTTTVAIRAASKFFGTNLVGRETGAGGALISVVEDATTPLMAALWALFAFAIGLAYYLPLLPSIYFLFGVINWFFDIVEGLLAMPFFAIANSMPEGNGPFSAYTQNAAAAWFGIMVRPPLMVGALIASHYVLKVATMLALTTFNTASIGVLEGFTMVGIPSALIMTGIFLALMIAVARRVFGTIVSVPEAAASWFGAKFAGRAEESHVQEIEGRMGVQGAFMEVMKNGGRRKEK